MTDLGMDLARIRALADAFDASDWDEVDLVVDGVRVQFSAIAGADAAVAPAPSAAPASTPAVAATPPAPETSGPTETAVTATGQGVPAETAVTATGHGVPAPSPGIFWHAPSPGLPPFVNVGDRVEADTVVGIVELMKLMNRVAAGVTGVVTAVIVANGESVEKGQSLVLVEPDPS